ncbi:MAG: hypothetical protein H6622_05040 [Halobacteriovoraceae bacterium]|nr:hypothetical protein [Halobacteriovoraceae bacterium]
MIDTIKLPSKIFIVDFEDSFTFNISSEIQNYSNIRPEIIHFNCIDQLHIDNNYKNVFILGPGPGHSKDYQNKIFPFLNNYLFKDNVFVMGICLGHQIICGFLGAHISYLKRPIHGQSIELPIFLAEQKIKKIVRVQMYNSLYVKHFSYPGISLQMYKNQCLIAKGSGLITYQFHPESVGTSRRRIWFQPMLNFMYNKADDKQVKSQRYLRSSNSRQTRGTFY